MARTKNPTKASVTSIGSLCHFEGRLCIDGRDTTGRRVFMDFVPVSYTDTPPDDSKITQARRMERLAETLLWHAARMREQAS